MTRFWLIAAALNAAIAVAAGAFGAHGLQKHLDARMLNAFEVGVRYHMYHALALLAVGWLSAQVQGSLSNAAGACFLLGILLFSGSLYALAISGITRLGIITPFGGTLFLIGWVLFALAAARWRTPG